MSATDELRNLLDERGVKYQKINEHVTWVFLENRAITFFSDELGVSAEVSYPKPVLNGTKFLTPEQAIADTLADDDYERKMDALLCRLTNGKFSKSRAYDLDFMESCVNEEFEMLYADELNATLGRGTGEWVLEHSGTLYDKWRCSKCGYLFVEPRCDQGYTDLEPNFCPKCGVDFREVVGE